MGKRIDNLTTEDIQKIGFEYERATSFMQLINLLGWWKIEKKPLKVWLSEGEDMGALDEGNVIADIEFAFRLLRLHAPKIRFIFVPNKEEANLIVEFGEIDGKWQVLAYAELPEAGQSDGRLHIVFDVDENWFTGKKEQDGISFLIVFIHELLHFLGFDHIEGIDSILNPFYVFRTVYLSLVDVLSLRKAYSFGDARDHFGGR